MTVHVFGIRHHGPGCARSLRAALRSLAPDVVLIEGPPDAEPVLPLAARPDMEPPVALLVYPTEAPRDAVFYPFAVFSPEWQALRHAFEQRVPVRFIDLPVATRLALAEPSGAPAAEDEGPAGRDPLELLAEAAGYADHELWWEHQIERNEDPTGASGQRSAVRDEAPMGPATGSARRRNPMDLFEAIREAMAAVRADLAPRDRVEALREAHMRTMVRAAVKEGHERIAVVCGAWHAPVLHDHGTAKADAALLKGLPRTKVEATWIPWTHSRLAFRSGYGAGVSSPGWYHHLWTAPDRAVTRWAVEMARLLRGEDLDAPSASVIEVVRLSEALATLRGLRAPGLAELDEAATSILCGGDRTRLQLVHERLVIGHVLGRVPAEVPGVPLQRDLQAKQKALRLKATGEIKPLALDLRNDNDRERSRLFHRLALLSIPWATPRPTPGRKLGTFHEAWELRWLPEMEVALIEASVWGQTVESAAEGRASHQAAASDDLAALAALLDRALLAELPHAVERLLARIQERAAVGADVQLLMEALPPLARASRYGDVRQTPTGPLLAVIGGLFERIVVGLPGASRGVDEAAAGLRLAAMIALQESLGVLDDAELQAEWEALLEKLHADGAVHGLLRGWGCRTLYERHRLDEAGLEREASLALSPATPPIEAAAWLEGLLRGPGLLLLHHGGLWRALDRFLGQVAADAFQELLPLLRRAFATFAAPERRAMGEKVRKLRQSATATGPARAATDTEAIDLPRADRVLPVLAAVLGLGDGEGQ